MQINPYSFSNREVESQVNEYLAENKSRIVEAIFGIPVSCGEIRVEVEDTVNTYFVSSLSGYRNKSIGGRSKG